MAASSVLVLKNYINGVFVPCKGTRTLDVMNPATDEVIHKVPMSTPAEVDECIQLAHKAYLKWKEVPAIQRIQPLLRCLDTIKARKEELARSITINHGKEYAAATAEVVRAYQMIESALCTPEWQKGEFMENVANEIDEYSIRVPLGVFVHIPPFNFPGMVPFWFWPYAVAAGNTYIVKSNEVTPVTMQLMFECIDKAGFPPGVINYIHGDVEVANLLIDHPLVKGVSSVGSTPVAKAIYTRASALGKRAQCHGGANNFMLVMPSANLDEIIPNILNSAFGNTGQRCLAGSTIVAVGNEKWYQTVKDKFVEACRTKVHPGSGFDDKAFMGPVVTKRALAGLHAQIEEGLREGAHLLLDGRGVTVPGFPKGYWLGATVFEGAKPGMKCYEEEIFGPVCRVDHIATLDEAIARINAHPKGNAATIYTENGAEARKFRHECAPGMVGINIGLVAPIAWFPFSGAKDSFIGTLRAQGRECFEFFTQEHVVVERFHGHGKIEWD
eukprot:TRINITY_DN1094_c0_g1_i3.p2 TRINITY_DN1094_c0_g1~~TRINITY_DN1094_c0_g1_i3.p2  ORF type:complete len:519 (-),score=220.20 TRINITY_DN1094_c0_g1_i3:81-1577(-)